jgi:tRNA 5-methylaminomethyl-2-thiouridine biosynthesis bifunctional protein
MFEPLTPALAVSALGDVPYSLQYGDIYHSSQDALGQAHHIFLRGSGLPERWRGRERFTVCETGFGLGINFLMMWQAWREDPERCARLHMVSIEAHPFEADQLTHWLRRRLPDSLQPLVAELAAKWPPLLPGLHRLEFEGGAVTLTLALGKAHAVLPQLQFAADAFFLDGFAPRRNPDMWSEGVMRQLAELGASGATVATWATAGAMRRGLRAAGFVVAKRPGFGPKREMTVATLPTAGARAGEALDPVRRAGRAVVIGSGLAGAGVARSLAERGWQVEVVDGGPSPRQVSGPGHLAAALTPMVDADDSVRARLARAGALRAAARWQPPFASAGHADAGHGRAAPAGCHGTAKGGAGPGVLAVGTVQVAKARLLNRPDALAAWEAGIAALRFPPEWVRIVDDAEASHLAGQTVGRGGLYFPGGLLVRPQVLCADLLGHPAVGQGADTVRALRRTPAGTWQVECVSAGSLEADVVVIAAARGTPGLLAASGLEWPLGNTMQHVAGQITLMPSDSLMQGGPRCIVAGEGYVLPAVAGWCVAGSTYDHNASPAHAAPVSDAGHGVNLAKAGTLLPGLLPEAGLSGLAGWGGWRAVLRDRMPAIGELRGAPGIWIATGYASRGVTWSALAGDVIGGRLAGEPDVIERGLMQAVSAQRA